MIDVDPKTRWFNLFNPGEFNNVSPIFGFRHQVTIRGIGLIEGDEITFNILKIKAGDLGQYCDCISVPQKEPEIEASQPLVCGECTAAGEYPPVRMTKDNPVIVLDAPQNTLMVAVYKGDGIGTASVMALFNTTTNTNKLDPGMRGCPVICAEPDWQLNDKQRCNIKTDKLECQEDDGLGNTRWIECGDLVWTNTGEYQITTDNKVQRQQTDQCGDLRWVDVDESEVQWSATGNVRCDIGDDTASATYTVEREYINQFDQRKWEVEETRDWTDTGVIEDTGSGTVRKQQATICNDLRWVLVDDEGIVWTPTGNFRCINASAESNTYTISNEYRSQYGQLKWEDGETVSWVDTGETRTSESGKLEKQQTNRCNDLRWVEVDTSGAIWTATGRENCIVTDDSDTYQISRQYVNQYGQTEWRNEETREWTDTGVEACIDHVINKQQTTVCNEMRWKPTETPCGYFATMPLPGGGAAFRPDQQPPDATVALQDCDGTTIGYIYPSPREGATVEVNAGCGADGGDLIGYAVGEALDFPSCGCFPKKSDDDEERPSVIIPNEIELVTGKPVQVHILSMPKLAVGTFERCDRTWILFNDGTYQPVDMTCPQDKPITKTIAITYVNLFSGIGGEVPAKAIVEAGKSVNAPAWSEEPENTVFRGWSKSPDCKTVDYAVGSPITERYSLTLYAVWEFVMSYTTDGEAENMPSGQSYNPAVGFTVSGNTPTRTGFTFVNWQDTANGDKIYSPSEEVKWNDDEWNTVKPSVFKAVWQASE